MSTRHLFTGSGYVLGRFDCRPGDPLWSEVNWIGPEPHVVVPHTAVGIAAAGADETVATPFEILVYDRDTHYRRRLVGAAGDRSVFAVLGDALADEWALPARPRRPRVHAAATPPETFARLAHAALAAEDGTVPDPPALDEWLLTTLATTVGAAAGRTADGPAAARATARPAHRAAVEEVKARLAADPLHRWSLADLGAAVHYSPYGLARMFRAHTGHSITAFRRGLLLRVSYPAAIRAGADLSRIAAEHGFASHSHYTREFRRVFGHPPSAARRHGAPAAR